MTRRKCNMKQNLAPLNSKHTFPNMFRLPYGKELPISCSEIPSDSYQKVNSLNDFQKDIDILFDTFLERYNKFKAGEMASDTEVDYKSLGIPGPTQYEAFSELVSFFHKEEFEFFNQHNYYFYDLTINDDISEIGMVEFIKNGASG
jgi:hypothetical protein